MILIPFVCHGGHLVYSINLYVFAADPNKYEYFLHIYYRSHGNSNTAQRWKCNNSYTPLRLQYNQRFDDKGLARCIVFHEWRQVTHVMRGSSRSGSDEDGKAQRVDRMARVTPLLAGENLIV
jgi:hypothetical protein